MCVLYVLTYICAFIFNLELEEESELTVSDCHSELSVFTPSAVLMHCSISQHALWILGNNSRQVQLYTSVLTCSYQMCPLDVSHVQGVEKPNVCKTLGLWVTRHPVSAWLSLMWYVDGATFVAPSRLLNRCYLYSIPHTFSLSSPSLHPGRIMVSVLCFNK